MLRLCAITHPLHHVYRNEEVGGWDTPDAARMLLRSVSGAHQMHLEALPSPQGSGSLADLAAGVARYIPIVISLHRTAMAKNSEQVSFVTKLLHPSFLSLRPLGANSSILVHY